jgi:anaerobic glycerol-3-phosphate dehydrogenase
MNATDPIADRVLILGGGMAGVACAQKLGDHAATVEASSMSLRIASGDDDQNQRGSVGPPKAECLSPAMGLR